MGSTWNGKRPSEVYDYDGAAEQIRRFLHRAGWTPIDFRPPDIGDHFVIKNYGLGAAVEPCQSNTFIAGGHPRIIVKRRVS